MTLGADHTSHTADVLTRGWNPLPGIDSDQLRWENEDDLAAARASALSEPTIAEDRLAEAQDGEEDITAPSTPRHAKRHSYNNRLSKLSDDRRLSVASSKLVDGKGSSSNRSSATIKGPQANGHGTWGELDFDKALRKFAGERDAFINELTLSAGAVVRERGGLGAKVGHREHTAAHLVQGDGDCQAVVLSRATRYVSCPA